MSIKNKIFLYFFSDKQDQIETLKSQNNLLTNKVNELDGQIENYNNHIPKVSYEDFLQSFWEERRMPTKEEKQAYNDKYSPYGWVLALSMRKLGQLDPSKCVQFIEAFKKFDFEKVHIYMTKVNWTWSNTEYGKDLIPTIKDLHQTVFELASSGGANSGGFNVVFTNDQCKITFDKFMYH